MNVKGKIKVVEQTIVVNEKFRKRAFVVVTNETYPQEIAMQLSQDKVDLIDNFSIGQDVDVSINLRGRSWTGDDGVTKYFNTIEAWKIDAFTAIPEPSKDMAY